MRKQNFLKYFLWSTAWQIGSDLYLTTGWPPTVLIFANWLTRRPQGLFLIFGSEEIIEIIWNRNHKKLSKKISLRVVPYYKWTLLNFIQNIHWDTLSLSFKILAWSQIELSMRSDQKPNWFTAYNMFYGLARTKSGFAGRSIRAQSYCRVLEIFEFGLFRR